MKKYKKWNENYGALLDDVKYMCPCGHKTIIPNYADKGRCSWCGRFVFKNKKDEGIYRILELKRTKEREVIENR